MVELQTTPKTRKNIIVSYLIFALKLYQQCIYLFCSKVYRWNKLVLQHHIFFPTDLGTIAAFTVTILGDKFLCSVQF